MVTVDPKDHRARVLAKPLALAMWLSLQGGDTDVSRSRNRFRKGADLYNNAHTASPIECKIRMHRL